MLAARGIPHAWSVGPGGHEGSYWEDHLPAYLRFYDQGLNPNDSSRASASQGGGPPDSPPGQNVGEPGPGGASDATAGAPPAAPDASDDTQP